MDDPFDPPRPPNPSALATAATIAGGTGLLAALALLDQCTGGLLTLLIVTPAGIKDSSPIDVRALEAAMPGLAETAAPTFTADHRAVCTRCSGAAPFASMSLSEHGYFCAPCAASLR